MTRKNNEPAASRQTLFGRAPDWGRSPFDEQRILDVFGYENVQNGRRELHCTVNSAKNAQGFRLDVREAVDDLVSMGETASFRGDVTVWSLKTLKNCLRTKHRETFWVSVSTRVYDGREFFHYDSVVHTRRPCVDQMPALFDDGSLSADFLMNSKPSGAVRDHGFLFRMPVSKLALLFPNETRYDLASVP